MRLYWQAIDEEDDLSLPPIIQRMNQATIGLVKSMLTTFYHDRPYARFAALETIARVPYFSYTSNMKKN
eukprot:scaffold1160_cov174-Ochromonas_danica.AAC.29